MWIKVGFLVFTFISVATAEKCTTPNNEEAQCISLHSCPILANALASDPGASLEFVRRSKCGGTASNPLICCGSTANFTAMQNKVIENRLGIVNKTSLLPQKKYCGYQHADDYVHTGNGTQINEFPWLAGLIYDTSKTKGQTLCGGSLISNRYVLTAGHCLNNTRVAKLVAVRLGEYNVKNQTDCVEEDTDLPECSEPPQDLGIEKIVVHPNFDSTLQINDIALIRLDRKVTYSDYIRPICLPTPGTTLAKIGDILTTSGWGRNAYQGNVTETKKKIFVELITNEECAASSAVYKFITNTHLCTKEPDTNTEFACSGDSGSPTMFSVKNQWHQEGIATLGRGCHSGFPDVHTRVTNYFDWIVENLEQ